MKKVTEFARHSGPIYALAHGRHPGTLFSGSADRKVAEWNLDALGPSPFSVNVDGTIFSLCYIPENSLLLIGRSNGGLHIVDLEKGEEIKHWKAHKNGIFDIRYSLRTNCFYTLGGDGILSIWSLKDLTLFRQIPLGEKKLRKMDFNGDHSKIAIASGDAKVRVLDTEMYNELHTVDCHHPGANVVAFHPSADLLLTAGRDAHLSVWDITGTPLMTHTITAHYYPVYSLVFSPDGKTMATCSRDKSIKIWDANNFDFLKKLTKADSEGHRGSVNTLLWERSTNQLISAGDDGKIMVWKE